MEQAIKNETPQLFTQELNMWHETRSLCPLEARKRLQKVTGYNPIDRFGGKGENGSKV